MKRYMNRYLRLRRMLKGLETYMPHTMDGFNKLYRHKANKGALSAKCKELIALSLAVSGGSTAAATMQLPDVIKSGASDQEIIETIEVAIMMGGTPALVAGSEVVDALSEFRAEREPDTLYAEPD
ncbi:MAG: carboxymuconolactone decarboxylase family protein [Saprospiraceae bacterium]|nr:carboxymuconolactone decarboxylase family protein [Saprospiraceae bacterium]